ncbi:MAG: pantetheine-phosphate adenylyltransferase [bacterium]
MKDFSYQAKVAVYPGSFDPITLGHVDIVKRAINLFDKLIILVLKNYRKTPFFSINERINLIRKCLSNNPKIEIDNYSGLLVDYMKERNIKFIVKGLRAVSDFEYEFQQHMVNSKMLDVETIFFMTSPEYNYLSSSLVREIAFFDGDLSLFIPQEIIEDVKTKIAKFKQEKQ